METENDRISQDSNTYKNLKAAYADELTACAKYEIYGIKAREDGYEQIGCIFDESARNEREHAEIWLKILKGGEIPSTLDNLRDAYAIENAEWSTMYVIYAEEARREGYHDVARLFDAIASIERHHDARFRKLSHNIIYDQVFCKTNNVLWVCLHCGNLFFGECAPNPCPVCSHPQGYYQLNCENY